jgi:hypothetical protein
MVEECIPSIFIPLHSFLPPSTLPTRQVIIIILFFFSIFSLLHSPHHPAIGPGAIVCESTLLGSGRKCLRRKCLTTTKRTSGSRAEHSRNSINKTFKIFFYTFFWGLLLMERIFPWPPSTTDHQKCFVLLSHVVDN